MNIANHIATTVVAIHNCEKSGNKEWLQRHTARLDMLIDIYMPSGSGWDCGTKIDVEKSNEFRLLFSGSFHHMDEDGGYDGWTEHRIAAQASHCGLGITVSGKDRNDIKDYLADLFRHTLSHEMSNDDIAAQYAKRGL